ncbi:hypothetical protein ACLOJK_033890 [Asimina triloba]
MRVLRTRVLFGDDPAVNHRRRNDYKSLRCPPLFPGFLFRMAEKVTTMSPIIQSHLTNGAGAASPKASLCRCDSGSSRFQFSGGRSAASPRSVLHFQTQGRSNFPTNLRRTASDTLLIRSEITCSVRPRSLYRSSSTSLPAKIAEEEKQGRRGECDGCSVLKQKGFELGIWEMLPENEMVEEELEFSGGGMGKGTKVGGGRGRDGSGNGDREGIGAYYEEMLKANPGNPLLLRNYGKFLHEVERDFARAEEYYGRAILASPGDGEVLSLYGKLIWETKKDQSRAEGYFDQAVRACPDDCYVLGSYAHFLWGAEEEEEAGSSLPLVEAH